MVHAHEGLTIGRPTRNQSHFPFNIFTQTEMHNRMCGTAALTKSEQMITESSQGIMHMKA